MNSKWMYGCKCKSYRNKLFTSKHFIDLCHKKNTNIVLEFRTFSFLCMYVCTYIHSYYYIWMYALVLMGKHI